MNVFFGLEQLPHFRQAVVTIGTFDGVHLGHRVILDRLKKKAAEIGGETVIITFEPHPRFVVSSAKQTISLLNTLNEKIDNLSAAGIDHLVVVPFTLEFAGMEAADYVEKFLVHHFKPHTVIIGYDHQFGKNRQGDFKLLEAMKEKWQYELEEIPMQIIEQNKISSTQIREALETGQVTKAAQYLGKPYTLQGKVIEGKKLGRELGYPTANITLAETYKLIPASGVYAVLAILHGKQYKGMLNIGTNPTVTDGAQIHIEVHLFDFDQMIYGETLTLQFIERLRDELKFAGVSELVQALDQDKEHALKVLSGR